MLVLIAAGRRVPGLLAPRPRHLPGRLVTTGTQLARQLLGYRSPHESLRAETCDNQEVGWADAISFFLLLVIHNSMEKPPCMQIRGVVSSFLCLFLKKWPNHDLM